MPSRPSLALWLLLAALLVLLPGCSRKAERLVGNERLLRGPGGLGNTTRTTVAPDRDTWVETGTRAGGPVLLVAKTGTFEAVTHLKVASWRLPIFADTAGAIRSVILFAPALVAPDTVNTPTPIPIQLGESDAAWDTSFVAWPGPGMASVLGDSTWDPRTDGDLFTIRLVLPSPGDSLKKWRDAPSSVPGFQLRAGSTVPASVGAFKGGALFFRVAYDSSGQGIKTIDSPITTDLYVHSPIAALATGGEPTLSLGGHEGRAAAMHFPVPDLPAGASINEGTLLLHVNDATDSTAFLAGPVTIDIEVRSLGSDWLESVTGSAALGAATAASATVKSFAYRGVADSLIAIPLPVGMIRGWRATASSNHGLLLTAVRGDAAPVILIDSRETPHPPQLRLSYTTAPKGRF